MLPRAASSGDRQLLSEQVKLLYRQAPAGLVATPLLSTIAVPFLWNVVGQTQLLVWYAVSNLIIALRYGLVAWYRRNPTHDDQIERWRDLFMVSVLATGAGWGYAGFYLFPGDSPLHQAFAVVIIAGVTSGAVSLLSPLRRVCIPFLILVSLPLITRLVQTGEPALTTIGATIGIYALIMIFASVTAYRMSTHAIKLGLENVGLVEKLSTANTQEKEANEQLVKEITERKLAEVELLRYEHIVSASPDMMSFIDRDYKYVTVNDAYESYLNLPTTEIIGRRVSEFVGDEKFDQVVKPKMDPCLAGKSARWHAWIDYPCLGRRYMDAVFEPVRNNEGVVVGIAASVRDITDLRLAEEELSRINSERNHILRNARINIVVTEGGKVIRVDGATETVWGWKADECLGMEAAQFFARSDEQVRLEREGLPLVRSGQTCDAEVVLNRKDGTEFPARVVGSALDPADISQGIIWMIEDISQRKEAEKTLKQVFTERNLALERARISINRSEGRLIVQTDPAFEQMFGWKPTDMPEGLDAKCLYARTEDFARVGREVLPALARGEICESEFLAKQKNGDTFSCRIVASVTDPDGSPEEAIWLTEDITERKQANAALREVEERSRMALWAANAVAWSWEVGSENATWSDENYRLLGFEPGEVEANYNSWLECIHPDEREKTEQALNHAIEEERSLKTEYRIIRPDGEVRWIELIARMHHDDVEKQNNMYGLQVDITERKKNEELGVRFGRIIEESLNEIYVFDGETLEFLLVNKGARNNLGYSNAELSTLTPLDIAAEFTPEQFEDLLAPLRDGTEPRLNIESTHRRKDGSTYDVNVHLQYVQTETPPVFAVIVEDISQNKLIENSLRQAQKMEAVGQLTAGVAHDFNNLLGIILASVELAGEESDENNKDSEFLQKAIRAVERGENLTRRLLAFSRKQTLRPQIIEANELVIRSSELLRRTIPESIEIRNDLAVALWTTKVDPGQLEDALLNLAINARDAMPAGGTLTILTRNELHSAHTHPKIPIANDGEFVRISISDTGTGMSPETLEHVFEPFFTTKEVGQGSGLGLSMVYGFAKQSDGHVTIDSVEGRGTTVSICLPAEAGVVIKETLKESTELPQGNGESILIVEDDPDVRDVTVATLRSLGYAVIAAENGKEGLAALEAAPHIEVLLSDVVLPRGMNGAQLCKEALKIRPDLVCVLMSGYADLPDGTLPEDITLLNKPVRRKELANALCTALDRQAA